MAIQTLTVHGKTNDSLSDLSIIGVPDDQQNKVPSSLSYPRKFNSVAFPV